LSRLKIQPALALSSPPDGPNSLWIGALDIADEWRSGLELLHAKGYARARLLIRDGRVPLGFVEVEVSAGMVTPSSLTDAINKLPKPSASNAIHSPAPITVVLCTRDRPESLRQAIASLLAIDFPDFEILIVDNASATNASQLVVEEVDDPRIRLVFEQLPGLARARNRGVLLASHEFIAFTDDDVMVDSHWLTGLMDGFNAADDVACVCGMVPTGELRSFAQAYFDGRVTWGRSCIQRLYRLATPPEGQVLFPFQVGQYGTGANFGMRRSTLIELGGFDEALGVGSPTRGGEDIDMFVRVLLAGHALVYQPSALVWHRHRADVASLGEQIAGYGVGLGAWIAKLLADRTTAPMVLRRAVRGARHARQMTHVTLREESGAVNLSTKKLAAVELWAAASGPFRYLQARLNGARSQPLLVPLTAAPRGESRPPLGA
jgi:GT2 family glycosyltransferase